MTHRPNGRGIRIHRSYTVDELARATGACKATVRRWIKAGLPAMLDRKPALILGQDARAFLNSARRPKQRCASNEFYCLRCRAPRRLALGEAEVVSTKGTTSNLRGLCEVCTAVMQRRVSAAQLDGLARVLTVRGRQEEKHLTDTATPCPNVHLRHGGRT